MQFIPAANFTKTRGRVIDLVVLHSMEAPEKGSTAEAVARYFQRKEIRASAHYCLDNDSIVKCVEERDVAWHAPGANHNSIGLEHAGYAKQSRAEWGDPYSASMLALSAALTREIVARHGIPVVFRNAADLRAGGSRGRGITTHHEVSQAFRRSDHWDPGPGFPIDHYLGLVNANNNPKGATVAAPTKAVDAAIIPNWRAPDGQPGRWIVQADGGVFTYPQAANDAGLFFGGMGGQHLNAPISGIVAHPDGRGYWLIAQDGGIFAFGSAPAVAPYMPFFDEYAVGAHAMVDAEFDGTTLTCLADDGAFYTYKVTG